MFLTFLLGSIVVGLIWLAAFVAVRTRPATPRPSRRKSIELDWVEDDWLETGPDRATAQERKQSARGYRKAAGRAGEGKVADILEDMGIEALHDLRIPHEGGGAQIDHVALVGKTLLVLETKNFTGSLRASIDASHWEKARAGQAPTRIYNPLKQNERHAEVVRFKVGSIDVHPMVVLVGNVQLNSDDDLEDIIFLEELRPLLELHSRHQVPPRARAAFRALARYAQGR